MLFVHCTIFVTISHLQYDTQTNVGISVQNDKFENMIYHVYLVSILPFRFFVVGWGGGWVPKTRTMELGPFPWNFIYKDYVDILVLRAHCSRTMLIVCLDHLTGLCPSTCMKEYGRYDS